MKWDMYSMTNVIEPIFSFRKWVLSLSTPHQQFCKGVYPWFSARSTLSNCKVPDWFPKGRFLQRVFHRDRQRDRNPSCSGNYPMRGGAGISDNAMALWFLCKGNNHFFYRDRGSIQLRCLPHTLQLRFCQSWILYTPTPVPRWGFWLVSRKWEER